MRKHNKINNLNQSKQLYVYIIYKKKFVHIILKSINRYNEPLEMLK